MQRYNLRPLPHRNMAQQNVNDNPAPNEQNQHVDPLENNSEMLQELHIISHELSSQGTLNKIALFDGSDLSKFRNRTHDVSKQCAWIA